MPDTYSAALGQLGLALPPVSAPGGAYTSTVTSGNLLYVSGQISQVEGKAYLGKLGADLSVEQGQEAARVCALNIVAHVSAALGGDLDRVRRCVRIGGFVNAVPEFSEQSQVLNGASDLMVALFGERGRHVRAAVGVGSLPRGVAVEVEAIFEIAP